MRGKLHDVSDILLFIGDQYPSPINYLLLHETTSFQVYHFTILPKKTQVFYKLTPPSPKITKKLIH